MNDLAKVDRGAYIEQEYLGRKKQVIAVDANDLKEIKQLDGLQAFTFAAGNFFLAGALWLLAEKVVEAGSFEFTALNATYVVSMLFGLILSIVGWKLRKFRVDKIETYFNDLEPLS